MAEAAYAFAPCVYDNCPVVLLEKLLGLIDRDFRAEALWSVSRPCLALALLTAFNTDLFHSEPVHTQLSK
jgi:hypothetical protein